MAQHLAVACPFVALLDSFPQHDPLAVRQPRTSPPLIFRCDHDWHHTDLAGLGLPVSTDGPLTYKGPVLPSSSPDPEGQGQASIFISSYCKAYYSCRLPTMSLSMQGSGRECWENSPRMDLRDRYSREHRATSKSFSFHTLRLHS